ncbi:TRAP transporter substrate-binding protein DctP [Hydrocarboniclastica marina]|uniref:TRAP transporter substrate-binding protein DctP n=1 Tax=Hydrocarboniclastica marina TaxID=2259620 RepID=A0A4P7XJZ4_9ALTE|nr:TRAP transporter substrate-binding protein DctP [Hydrocarboniclastica marina]QCF27499.1 TRAP transporter substrate-binding protein DctP [Hydrocarboniclastica marina]
MMSFVRRVTIGAAVAACLSSGAAVAEDTFNFRVTSALSPNHGQWQGFFKPWMEKVEEESDGRISFTTFVSGELVKATNEPDALKQGIVQIAAPLLPTYDPALFPMSEVPMLPLAKSSPKIGSLALKALLESDVPLKDGKTFSELEYEANGLVAIPITISEEYSISTTGQRFETVEDVKSVTLRTPSRIHEMYAANVGINSITMPAFDLFDALSRGAVDGSFLFISDWTGYGFDELFKYTVTDVNLGHFASVMAVTEEQWNKLPEDLQKIMLGAADEQITEGAQLWVDRREKIMKETKAKGAEFVSVHDLPPEVSKLLMSGMEQTWFDYIAKLEEKGLPGTELARLWRDIVIEQGGDVPAAIHDL